MAARRRKQRRITKRRSKTLTERVTALERAIKPPSARQRRIRVVSEPGRLDMTPPHIRRQLGL